MRSDVGGRSRWRWAACALLVAASCAVVPAAQAQRPQPAPVRAAAPANSPLWAQLTLGGAGARLTCDICTPQRDVGAMLTAALGAYASPRLRIGMEAQHWTYRDAGVREYVNGIGVVVHYAPRPAGGLHLIGGAGASFYRAGEFRYDAPRVTMGLGYDLPAMGRFVVGNVVTMDVAAFGTLKSEGATVIERVGYSSVRAAVQVRRR